MGIPARNTNATRHRPEAADHAPVVGRPDKPKERAWQILDAAESLGWVAHLSSGEWALTREFVKWQGRVARDTQGRDGWREPICVSVSFLAKAIGKSERQVWRVRASLELQGVITVHRGHGYVPGKAAQAAWYRVHYGNLSKPYGEVNRSESYEAAKAAADRDDGAHVTSRVTGDVSGPDAGHGALNTYDTHQPSSSADESENAQIDGETMKKNQKVMREEAGPTVNTTPPAVETSDCAGDGRSIVRQLVDHVVGLDGVSLAPRELRAPPKVFLDAVRACVDAGMTLDALSKKVTEAVERRTGPAVTTLRYLQSWLDTAAAEATAREQEQEANRAHLRRVRDEQIARRRQNPELHERLCVEERDRLAGRQPQRDREAQEADVLPDPTPTPISPSADDERPENLLSDDELADLRKLDVGCVPTSGTRQLEEERTNA